MRYLALGDSISIDAYTGVVGGGAASQFARLLDVTVFEDLTEDGCTTEGVLAALEEVHIRPSIVTLTAGGNDFLLASYHVAMERDPKPSNLMQVAVSEPLTNLRRISEQLATYRCPVIMNTIYDPTDGNDTLAGELGMSAHFRHVFNVLNNGIRGLAQEHDFLLCDLERLFAGHGMKAVDTWVTRQIEPNYAGATAIAHAWRDLYQSAS